MAKRATCAPREERKAFMYNTIVFSITHIVRYRKPTKNNKKCTMCRLDTNVLRNTQSKECKFE